MVTIKDNYVLDDEKLDVPMNLEQLDKKEMKNILNNIKAEDLLIKRAVNMSPEEILLLSDKLEDIILKK